MWMASERDGVWWKRIGIVVFGARARVYAVERGFVEGDERDGVEEDVARGVGSGDEADDSGRHGVGERTYRGGFENPGGILLGGV